MKGSLPLATASGRKRIRRFVREVFATGEEPDQRPAFGFTVISDCAFEDGVFGFERIEDFSLGDWGGDFEFQFGVRVGQGAEMLG